jgi:hypothetical protein
LGISSHAAEARFSGVLDHARKRLKIQGEGIEEARPLPYARSKSTGHRRKTS